MENPDFSLLIPVYNGAKHLHRTIQELDDFFLSYKFSSEVIFINDGSTDKTLEILEHTSTQTHPYHFKYTSLKNNSGKGAALQHGYQHISPTSRVVGFTDVELPYTLSAIPQALNMITQNHADIVFGDRTQPNNHSHQYSLYRKFFHRIFRIFLPKIIRTIPDTQSGFKLFSSSAATYIFPKWRTSRWIFDIEIFLLAQYQNFSIKKIPVSVRTESRKGRGGVLFLTHSFGILNDFIRIFLYDKKGLYK